MKRLIMQIQIREKIVAAGIAVCMLGTCLCQGTYADTSDVGNEMVVLDSDGTPSDTDTSTSETNASTSVDSSTLIVDEDTSVSNTSSGSSNSSSSKTSTSSTQGSSSSASRVTSAASSTTTQKLWLSLSKVTLKKGRRYKIVVLRVPNTTKDKITYTSTNRKVAVVSATGIVTARKKGRTIVTVKSGSKRARLQVIVT